MPTLSKFNPGPLRRLKILVAPLDWGLGHATRCIPIIKELINLQCEVWIAATGAQRSLLKEQFPNLPFVDIPGYGITYGKNRTSTLQKLIFLIPKILIRIKQEKAWLAAFRARVAIDAVVSDNRYGLYGQGLFSVIITHQLCIKTPFGAAADRIVQRLHYKLINRFTRCWVPDGINDQSLAGELAHPARLPAIPTRYIGILSRLALLGSLTGIPSSCDVLALLSGPEPQRTIFEKIVLEQIRNLTKTTPTPLRFIIVRGLPGNGHTQPSAPNPEPSAPNPEPSAPNADLSVPHTVIYSHLPADKLNIILAGAELVIARSGYSTVMDLMKMGKKAVLIPTPGQTEQEYLGDYLQAKGYAPMMTQKGFSLREAIDLSRNFTYKYPENSMVSSDQSEPKTTDNILNQEIRLFLEKLLPAT